MKVAVYSIALNEAKHVQRWAESASDAEYLVIADTGSSDNTVQLARNNRVETHHIWVNPWRFDDARNAALALVPDDADYCIALDLDEVLIPGWRDELERAHELGITRPRYNYVWSWTPEGEPDVQYSAEKIHTRNGYRWTHPVHEVIVPVNGFNEHQGPVAMQIHHHADDTKPRSSYLPLLELSVIEDPEDDRNTFYLARELFFNGRTRDAAVQFKRHLSLPKAVWKPERAASMRYLAKLEPYEAEHWLLRACAEAPGYREPWLELAELYAMNDMWGEARGAALRGLQITRRQQEYLTESRAWSGRLEELLRNCEACMTEIELGLNHSAPPVVHPA